MPVPGEGKLAGRSRRGECPPPGGSLVCGCHRRVLPCGGVGCFGVGGGGGVLSSPPRAPQILQEGVESSRRQLLIEAFVSAGRVDNITMVMGLHPQYLSSFWKTQYLLLRMDGPLPYHKRHYIAIMVSSGGARPLGGGPRGVCVVPTALLGSCLEVWGCWIPWVGTPRGGGPKKLFPNPFGVGPGVHISWASRADLGGQDPLSGPSSPRKPPVMGRVVASPRACTGVLGSLGSAGGG